MFDIFARTLMTASQQEFIGGKVKPQKTRYTAGWRRCCRFLSARARVSLKSL